MALTMAVAMVTARWRRCGADNGGCYGYSAAAAVWRGQRRLLWLQRGGGGVALTTAVAMVTARRRCGADNGGCYGYSAAAVWR